MTTVDDIRRSNLRLLIAQAKTVRAVAEKVGRSESLISQWVNGLADSRTGKPRGMRRASCLLLENAFGLEEGWMDRQHPITGEAPPVYAVAHPASEHSSETEIPLVPWNDLMKLPPPPVFCLRLPDEAIAPDFPAGAELVWSINRKLLPGRPVILLDQHGVPHARICTQGDSPGHWRAKASNPAYLSFDSLADRITLVAVYKGRLEPDDA